MVDPAGDPLSAPAAPRCPWCSAELPAGDVKTCPSCKANLAGETEAQLPGLTALDLERLAFRKATSPKKSRLMSWISGDSDYEDATAPPAQPGSLEPPPFEVRREMLRIEMAALIADLTAEAGAMAADEADAKGTDPVAAAAAIQAEIDAAGRAEQILVEIDGPPVAAAAPESEPSTGAADEPAPKPARTRRPSRPTRTPKANRSDAAGEPSDPPAAAEASDPTDTPSVRPDPETAPS